MKVRSGQEIFFEMIQPHFEVVLWSDSMSTYQGEEFKDLTYLNRDIRRTILMDCEEITREMYPENTLLVSEWDGEDDPESFGELMEYAIFLQNIACYMLPNSTLADVRRIIGPFNRKIGFNGKYADTLTALEETRKEICYREFTDQELENHVAWWYGTTRIGALRDIGKQILRREKTPKEKEEENK